MKGKVGEEPSGHSKEPTTSVALRVLRTFEKCRSFAGNRSVVEAWARAFDLHPRNSEIPQSVNTEVARQLAIVETQLDGVAVRIRKELPQLSHKTGLAQVDRLRILIGDCLSNLKSSWANHEANLSPDVMRSLEIWSELLPHDEVEISAPELSSLNAAIRELRPRLLNCSNVLLRQVLLDAIDLMEQAIVDYSVGGERSVRKAVRDAYATLLDGFSEIEASKDSEAVTEFVSIWRRFKNVCEPIIFADRLLSVADRARDLAGPTALLLGLSTEN